MSCYQLKVGGSGTSDPPTVDIPDVYSADDPGILINIYTSLTAYTSQFLFLYLYPISYFFRITSATSTHPLNLQTSSRAHSL